VNATDALSINVGGRFNAEQQEVSGRQDGIFPAVTRVQTTKRANFRQFTPRANIRYEIAPNTSVYASYSKGFRSGAYNSQLPLNTQDWRPAKEETIDAYEIGFKTAQDSFRIELAGFWYDYKNLQVSSTIVTSTGNAFVDVTNAPEAKIKGVEGNFDWEPIHNLTIRGGATYLDAEYGDGFFLSTVGVNPLGLPALNTNDDPLKAMLNFGQIQDLSGKQMARAPKFTANLGADYLAEMGFGSLRFAANAKYTDSYVVTNPAVWCDITSATPNSATICAGVPEERRDKQRFRQGSYVLLNASITYTDPSDHFFARLWANNLLDEKYRMHYTGNAQWGSYSPMAEPLTYGLTAGYKF
jgi:iron complex outermembrane receptor protein